LNNEERVMSVCVCWLPVYIAGKIGNIFSPGGPAEEETPSVDIKLVRTLHARHETIERSVRPEKKSPEDG
jgi:hypothetical protein